MTSHLCCILVFMVCWHILDSSSRIGFPRQHRTSVVFMLYLCRHSLLPLLSKSLFVCIVSSRQQHIMLVVFMIYIMSYDFVFTYFRFRWYYRVTKTAQNVGLCCIYVAMVHVCCFYFCTVSVVVSGPKTAHSVSYMYCYLCCLGMLFFFT